MKRFDKIANDQVIIKLYKDISGFEDLNKGSAHHHLGHAKNVAKTVESLLRKLNYNENFIEEAKIAALLHDTGAIEGKDNHALRSYYFAKSYLNTHHIVLQNEDLALEAIKIHSEGFDSSNIMALALILSDKLDITYTRLAKEGYLIKGMRQLQYIKDIHVDLQPKTLLIQFLFDPQINQEELESFYFITKVFKAIQAFSQKINRTPKVLFNNEEWQLFNKIQDVDKKF